LEYLVKMIIILFGVPGVGKGTLAAMLNKRYNLPHISSGNLLRELISKGIAGEDLKAIINKGHLVQDLIVYKIVGDRLKEKDCEKGVILDGFPRTVAQAEFLDDLIKNGKIDNIKVINFKASEETIIKRLSGRRMCEKCDAIYHLQNIPPKKPGICDKCGGKLIQREDDKSEIIKNRIEVYKKQTAPVMDFYKKKGILLDINTEQPIEKIFEDTCRAIDG